MFFRCGLFYPRSAWFILYLLSLNRIYNNPEEQPLHLLELFLYIFIYLFIY